MSTRLYDMVKDSEGKELKVGMTVISVKGSTKGSRGVIKTMAYGIANVKFEGNQYLVGKYHGNLRAETVDVDEIV